MSTKTKLLSTILLAGSLSLVAASDICAYTSRGCTGTFGCCSGIGEGVCCTYPANYGWSTKWQGMPLNAFWLGRTFGDFCSTSTSGAGSSTGSACSSVNNGPNFLAAVSANYDLDTRTRRSFEERDLSVACLGFDTIGFTTEDGVEHHVKISESSKFEDVERLVEEGKFSEVLRLQKVD